MVEIRDAIAHSYLGEGLSEEQIFDLVQLAEYRNFEDGDTILHEFDEDADLMILAEGRANIQTVMDEPIATLTPRVPFGEISLIDEQPRSATVTSDGPSGVVVLPSAKLKRLLGERQDIALILITNLCRVLCGRVRSMNRQVAALLALEELHEKA